ncbi:MAG: DNA polymerase III subunit gamma/tau [Rhizobiales bacterium]|nr:DNA polymerase III subunit gamma/tau [Hyphomicrobiales bacterium]
MEPVTSTGDDANGAAGPYVVLARKYRPQAFEDLIGQEPMVRTLRNAFSTGRIAQAYMLTGVRGVGKTTTARILARALNYAPCDSEDGRSGAPTIEIGEIGRHCREIIESRHPDVVEMDAASNTGIDNVREIIESARYRPVLARFKVFIIDEVHMLSKGAFNALLKTLEEPPAHVKFIFATTEVRKVPVTVLSRCQRFDLRRVDGTLLTRHFGGIVEREGGMAETEALALIARASEGSVRDGLSILDQALAIGSGKVTAENVRAMLGLADRGRTLDLFETVMAGDGAGALGRLEALHSDGAEPLQVLVDLAEVAHIVARAKVAGVKGAGEMLSAAEREMAGRLAGRLSLGLVTRAWQTLVKGIEEAGRAPDIHAAADMILIRLTHMATLPGPEELARLLAEGRGGGAEAQASGHAGPTLTSAAKPPLNRQSTPPPADAGAGVRENAVGARPNGNEAGNAQRPEVADDDTFGGDWSAEPYGEFTGEMVPDWELEGTPAPEFTLLTSLEDVVDLADRKRDIRLKLALENDVRPISFEPGRIEISVEDDAPSSLAGDLGRKLTEWTGQRWLVVISRTRGGATIAEERKAHLEREQNYIADDPVLAGFAEAFPDAQIKDIKPLTSGAGMQAAEDERSGSGQRLGDGKKGGR